MAPDDRGPAAATAPAATTTGGISTAMTARTTRRTAPRPRTVDSRRGTRRSRLRLLAAAAALTLPFAAALPAAAATPAAIPGVFVWQGAPPTVYSGADPVRDGYAVELPDTVQGPVSAVVAFAPGQLPSGYRSEDVARHLHVSCAIGDGAYQPCAFEGGPSAKPDLDGWLRLQLPTVDAASAITYHLRISADAGTLPADRLLTGWMELSGADGTVIGDGVAQLHYSPGLPDAEDRGQLYAVDTTGMLWRYEGTGNSASALRSRVQIGRGWDAYTAITPLSTTTASGVGDVVARDKSGVLWYYRGSFHTAQPFAPRVRVGAGWNIYTSIVGVGGPGYGGANGLVARDQQGVLWYYGQSGSGTAPFAPRVRVGAGWNRYNALSTYGDGIVGRTPDGELWSYTRDAESEHPVFHAPVDAGSGWGAYTAFSPLMVSTANPDVLAARDTAGRLWLFTDRDGTPQIPAGPVLAGTGWNIYTRLF